MSSWLSSPLQLSLLRTGNAGHVVAKPVTTCFMAIISITFPEKLSWNNICMSIVFPSFLLTLFPLFVQQTTFSLPRAVYVLSTELGAEGMFLFYFFYYFFKF